MAALGRCLAPALIAAALGAALSTEARAECAVGRVVIVPFDYLAAEAPVAREAEQRVREVAQRRMGGCVEARAATVQRLERLGPSLAACPDDACRAARAQALEAETVVEGIAVGFGGRPSVALSVWGRDGRAERRSVELGGPGVGKELDELFGKWVRRNRTSSPWPYVVLGAAAGAAAAGTAFGVMMQRNQQALSNGTACAGNGNALASCLEQRLAEGRRQAVTANALWGAGAALAAAGTVWLVWEWQ
ncbi:MAG TPA: hypothetical protein VND93_32140 [Myxococcales bacterium]|nr:hypothetical protein [Myxococcales bacterium]